MSQPKPMIFEVSSDFIISGWQKNNVKIAGDFAGKVCWKITIFVKKSKIWSKIGILAWGILLSKNLTQISKCYKNLKIQFLQKFRFIFLIKLYY